MKIKIKTQLLLDLSITSLFIIFSMTIMRFIIPNGFTTKFLLLGSKLIGFIFIISSVIFLIDQFLNKNFIYKKKLDFPKFKDFIFLTLPMSPVIDYAIINSEYLNLDGVFYLFGITLIFIIFFSFLLPILFSYFASFTILMFSGLALTFTVLVMAKISNNHNPGDTIFNSRIIAEGLYIIILFGVSYLLYLFDKRIAYIAVILFVLTGIIFNFFNNSPYATKKTREINSDRLTKFLNHNENKIVKKKNIYILVYESYANLETLKYYGFDNTSHMKFLENNGFKIYHGIYSNSAASIGSASRILEINDEIPKDGRHYTSGNAFSIKILKANGYKTSSVFKSSYFFGSSKINWDEYHPKEDITKLGGKTLTKAIFEGKFRFNIFDDDYDYQDYLELKKKYLIRDKKETLFWTHNAYPGHSGNSGKCAINENETYFKGMEKANIEMKSDISDILNNDKNSIIVLLSDHGPYLTKNCKTLENYNINEIDKYDVQDRYGAFLSIYWPKDILDNADQEIMITQDIFPAIFSNITKNKNLFEELKVRRKFFDRFETIVSGVNVQDGIIKGGKDDGKALFNKRSYNLSK